MQTRSKADQRNYVGSWIVTLPRAEATRAGVGEFSAHCRVVARDRHDARRRVLTHRDTCIGRPMPTWTTRVSVREANRPPC